MMFGEKKLDSVFVNYLCSTEEKSQELDFFEAQMSSKCTKVFEVSWLLRFFLYLLQHFHSVHMRFSLKDELPVFKILLCHILFILMHYKYINTYLD